MRPRRPRRARASAGSKGNPASVDFPPVSRYHGGSGRSQGTGAMQDGAEERRALALLGSVLMDCGIVENYMDGVDTDAWNADSMLQDAVERRLYLLGSTMQRLRSRFPHLYMRVPQAEDTLSTCIELGYRNGGPSSVQVLRSAMSTVPALRDSVFPLYERLEARLEPAEPDPAPPEEETSLPAPS